jgi:thioredoxin reductase (NADPH)
MATDLVDCLIVGAGPGGLVAATYLTRFHRRIAVVDAGSSRARYIPESHNCPGFPFGVSGRELLARLRTQAEGYGARIVAGRIVELRRGKESFVARDDEGRRYEAITVVLATGIVDRMPPFEGPPDALERAIDSAAVRLCAVCDGYEASDEEIAVYGPVNDAIRHAVFLRTFSRRVTAIHPGDEKPSPECAELAREAHIEVRSGARRLRHAQDGDGSGCLVSFDGETRRYDTVYPVLGGDAQSQLALGLGARADERGELIVDAKQETTVEGLYAIGDVVSALNQISVAMGQAAIAASAIHQRLPPNLREDESHQPDTARDLPSP